MIRALGLRRGVRGARALHLALYRGESDEAVRLQLSHPDLEGKTREELEAVYAGRECELWYTGFNSTDESRFCVERSTGVLLSANRTLSRLSEPRHCGRPELKVGIVLQQRGHHNHRLLFNRHTQ